MRTTAAMAGVAILATVALTGAAQAEDAGALLKRQTQALMDAVTYGKPKVWQDLLDDKCLITDETGTVSNKAKAVGDVQPLPKGISGDIRVTDWQVTVAGDVAVATHVDDEHENYHGQNLHALYRATGTWIKRASGWKLLGMQVLAMRQDPPAVALPASLTDQYTGRYSAAADVNVVIAKSGNTLTASTNGGKPVEIKAELADLLFTPGQPRSRRIFQRDAKGAIIGFVSRREERDIVFKKVK